MRLLLIEDDRGISHALAHALASTYEVDTAATGAAGLRQAELHNPDAIILDLNLPDLSGLVVCEHLRSIGSKAPIIVLTGETKIMSKITLLDAGADDYLTKPFSLGELKARLRAVLRHTEGGRPNVPRLISDDLVLNTETRQVERGGKVIKLRRKEFALLECLLQHAGSVVTREALTAYAWHNGEDPWTNTVDVHIKYLRDKVDRPFERPLIKTVHGVGYKLETMRSVAKIR